MKKGHYWSREEEDLLRDSWKEGKSVREISALIGRSESSINVKALRMNLARRGQPTMIKLTKSEEFWLKQNFPYMRNEICAMKLGVSVRSCIRLARKLGLDKSREFMMQTQRYTAMKAKESHLKNGTYPPKGVVHPNFAGSEKYRFKPGHKLIGKVEIK